MFNGIIRVEYRLSKQSGNKLKFLFKINRLLDSKLFSFFFYICM